MPAAPSVNRATALERRSAGTIRSDIIESASRLFYAEGIRSVSADRVLAAAGVSKATFYRHFGTKEDLVVAYLEHLSENDRSIYAAARERIGGDPAAILRWFADLIGRGSCRPGFRGCAFINAGAEYPDPASAVRRAIGVHREWFRSVIVELAGIAGSRHPQSVADHVVLLRDGAMISGYLGHSPQTLSATFLASVEAVL